MDFEKRAIVWKEVENRAKAVMEAAAAAQDPCDVSVRTRTGGEQAHYQNQEFRAATFITAETSAIEELNYLLLIGLRGRKAV